MATDDTPKLISLPTWSIQNETLLCFSRRKGINTRAEKQAQHRKIALELCREVSVFGISKRRTHGLRTALEAQNVILIEDNPEVILENKATAANDTKQS